MKYFKICCIIKNMENIFDLAHKIDKSPMRYAFHSHYFYEIYLLASGNVTYYIENEICTVSKGDVIVIPPGKVHRTIIKEGSLYDRYVLWLYPECISGNQGIQLLTDEVSSLLEEKNTSLISFDRNGVYLINKMFEILGKEDSANEMHSRSVCESCIVMILNWVRDALASTQAKQSETEDLISRVISRINHDIAGAPSLDELSGEFHVSKYYLSHRFKEYTGTSVHQYILMKRINMAKDLLDKGCRTSDVFERCGFSTYSNFYKTFVKLTGKPPKEFRIH